MTRDGELAAIAALEPQLAAEDDDALRRRATRLDRAVPVSAFALIREVARRVLGQRPFDSQILGGLALHRGCIVQMPTGEGKTLTAVAPTALAAKAGGGAHVLTFNDYLARRDAEWMGPVYRFLGLTVGCVEEGMGGGERRRAYGCDVTYLTAREAGFDLLRDGQSLAPDEQVQRPFRFALVDEADSILIDEARIPLVLAGTVGEKQEELTRLPAVVRGLRRGRDVETDEHDHNIFLTDEGIFRVEAALGGPRLHDEGQVNRLAAVRNALHAEFLLRRDVDYIVRGGTVELVDEFTGRVAENRHWPDGLQAAVEAKEGLTLGNDGRVLGSITMQHLLQLYPRLTGMTATAISAADELEEFYGLDVKVVEPHVPCIRTDDPDRIYTHREARDTAILEELGRAHAAGRPVLLGTASVLESERFSRRLEEQGIRHRVLNAKNDAEEAAIVAEAGALGAVTISTNMAGRGTDIRLGGADETDRPGVLALGGLYVIGTHRHESVRIDDQLRGRAGRQGDPGSSRFFISLDDQLLQRYGIRRLIPRRLYPDESDEPVDLPLIHREIDRAQRIVDGECFDVRRRLYRYSEIIEHQRKTLGEWRQATLEGRIEASLLRERAPARSADVARRFGETMLCEVERRLTLLILDRRFSEYLTEMQALRDEAHLVALVGKEPVAEFFRTAMSAFQQLVEAIEDEVASTFETLPITADGVDWEATGLRGPSATWTYMVSDDVFGGNLMHTLSHRHGLAVWAFMLLGPLLFVWGLYLHWKKRRRRH